MTRLLLPTPSRPNKERIRFRGSSDYRSPPSWQRLFSGSRPGRVSPHCSAFPRLDYTSHDHLLHNVNLIKYKRVGLSSVYCSKFYRVNLSRIIFSFAILHSKFGGLDVLKVDFKDIVVQLGDLRCHLSEHFASCPSYYSQSTHVQILIPSQIFKKLRQDLLTDFSSFDEQSRNVDS